MAKIVDKLVWKLFLFSIPLLFSTYISCFGMDLKLDLHKLQIGFLYTSELRLRTYNSSDDLKSLIETNPPKTIKFYLWIFAVNELLGLKWFGFYGIISYQESFYVSKAQISFSNFTVSFFSLPGPYPPTTIKYRSL